MLKNDLEASLKVAMKSGDTIRRDILRVVLTISSSQKWIKEPQLDDAAVISILQKEMKTHKESIEDVKKSEST